MPNRITGLNSGLDTESLVTSLVSSYQKKVDTLTGNQKRLEWKQDAWKSLNTSFTKFYNGPLDSMSMKSSYLKKVTTSTNASAVTISTKSTAMNATQKVKVNKTASSAFTTGGKVTAANGGATKLSELDGVSTSRTYKEKVLEYDEVDMKDADGNIIYEEDGETPKKEQVPRWQTNDNGSFKLDENGNKIQAYHEVEKKGYTLTLKAGSIPTDKDGNITGDQKVDGTVTLEFGADATIDDVISAIKGAKIEGSSARFNANFDATQGRIYMSASATGAANNFTFEDNSGLVEALGLGSTAKYNAGSDAEITLNGVDYKSDSGTFDINGLQITANEVTDQEFTITTKTDTSGIYDMVKDLLKQYNEMIKTLDTAYYADSSAKYSMLTDDEKYAMSDKEVEEWEKKIKDGLLSKDSTLSDITSGLKSTMLGGIEVTLADGTKKTLHLSDFGINTGSYLTTAKDERGVFHIDGDSDDIVSKSNEDKLKAWINSDPEAVADFFSQLAQGMRQKMFNQMKGTAYSSSFTIYEDKLMAQQYSSYNSQITTATERLNAKQDAYYAKFSKMETALAKLNSTQSSLGGFFGS